MDNYVPGTRVIQEDINNINLVQGKFDVCFHLAALSEYNQVLLILLRHLIVM